MKILYCIVLCCNVLYCIVLYCIVLYCIVSIHLYSASRSAHESEALALTRLGGADAVVLQGNCVRRTCSRSLHSNCLGRGSDPYSPRYRPSSLTAWPPCHTQ